MNKVKKILLYNGINKPFMETSLDPVNLGYRYHYTKS